MNRFYQFRSPSRQRQIMAGYFLAGLGAILFSAKAVVVKFTYRYGIDAVTLIAFRMLFAMPFFAAVAWWQMRRVKRGDIAALTVTQRWQIGVLGLLGYYLSSLLDFVGLQYVSASLERLILFLSPSLVVLLSAWWLKRAVTRRQAWAMVLSYLGVVLVFAHDLSDARAGSDVIRGSLFVFGSALSYSVYLICSGELVKRVGATRLVAYAMLVSCVACVIQFFVVHPPSVLLQPAGVYGYSLVHATLNTVLPVFMMMWAVALIGAPTASLLGMLGPVSVLFLAAWLLAEPITVWQLAGTALVLAGVVVLTGRRAVQPG
ncbi:DMT family transporter [Bordetella avium]|uniref:DMT family transporter n=1 Tax=Bordetella avium TaxID=521 RepID=UPI000E0BE5F0|nr:EamA family transporter [Bordetella avium]AZY52892.1 EamA family transporter [Bordetella avium]RIQ11728.1 DMT family transporter [Bordetella avium]RIQ16151.1 DMT family transporter [Bordetella avium]RIQ30304.1 DMT family transporter [Bordetella avium]